MIERHHSAEVFNTFLNDPFVRPDVADMSEGKLDIESAAQSKDNVLLVGEHGGNIFIRMMPGIYEVHTVSNELGRGEWIFKFVRQAAQFIFTKTDCYEVMTRIPRKHVAARKLAEAVGMVFEFSVEDGCVWRGARQSVDIYGYRIQDWIRQAHELEPVGELFHEMLHREARRLGITDPGHDNWPNHNIIVGSVWEMAKAGQIVKAVNWYSRWALAARHSGIKLVSIDPPQILTDIGLLTLRGEDIEVQECAGNMTLKNAS